MHLQQKPEVILLILIELISISTHWTYSMSHRFAKYATESSACMRALWTGYPPTTVLAQYQDAPATLCG